MKYPNAPAPTVLVGPTARNAGWTDRAEGRMPELHPTSPALAPTPGCGTLTTKSTRTFSNHFITMSRTSASADKLSQDLHILVRDTEELLAATTDDAGEKVRELRARLASALESAKVTAADFEARAMESVKEGARNTDRVIRDHPYESLAIAFGVGLLLGVVITRR